MLFLWCSTVLLFLIQDSVSEDILEFHDRWVNHEESQHSRVERQARRGRGGGKCNAQCSRYLMLSCDFPSLDPCLQRECEAACKSEKRVVQSCECRNVANTTFRACFCMKPPQQVKLELKAVEERRLRGDDNSIDEKEFTTKPIAMARKYRKWREIPAELLKSVKDKLDAETITRDAAAKELNVDPKTLYRHYKGCSTRPAGRPILQRTQMRQTPKSTTPVPKQSVASSLEKIFGTNLMLTSKFKRHSLMIEQINGKYIEYMQHHQSADGTVVYMCKGCLKIKKKLRPAVVMALHGNKLVGCKFPKHRCIPKFDDLSSIVVREVERKARLRVQIEGRNPYESWNEGRKELMKICLDEGWDIFGNNSVPAKYRAWHEVSEQFFHLRKSDMGISQSNIFNDIDKSCFSKTYVGHKQNSTDPMHSWLLGKSKKYGVIVFACNRDLEALSAASIIQCDATFKTAPRGFRQILTVHCLYKREWVPAVTALMQDKSAEAYEFVFKTVKDSLGKLGLNVTPQLWLTDFEVAEMKAVEKFFNVTVKGCLFHFTKALLKHVKSIGLWTWYTGHNEIHEWIRKIIALSLLPPDLVRITWEKFLSFPPSSGTNLPVGSRKWPTAKLAAFKQYFDSTYMNSQVYPIERWNHWQTGSHRTTNASEGYHSKQSRKTETLLKPKVANFLQTLQENHNATLIRLDQLDNGNIPKKRKARYVLLDQQLQQYQLAFSKTKQKRLKDGFALDSITVILDAEQYIIKCAKLLADMNTTGTGMRKQKTQHVTFKIKSKSKRAHTAVSITKNPAMKTSKISHLLNSQAQKAVSFMPIVINQPTPLPVIGWETKKYMYTCSTDNVLMAIVAGVKKNPSLLSKMKGSPVIGALHKCISGIIGGQNIETCRDSFFDVLVKLSQGPGYITITGNNFFGTEQDKILTFLSPCWEYEYEKQCPNPVCSKHLLQSRRIQDFFFTNFQETVLKIPTQCNAPFPLGTSKQVLNSIGLPFHENQSTKRIHCTSQTQIQNTKLRSPYPWMLAISVAGKSLQQCMTLPKAIILDGHNYHLQAITMHEPNHFTSLISWNNSFYFYNGIGSRFRPFQHADTQYTFQGGSIPKRPNTVIYLLD